MKSILLIGLGRFGRHIAQKLNDLNYQVMAVDNNEERVNRNLSIVTNAQIGDSTDADFLSSLGIRNYDVCIVAIGDNFQNSLETASLLKELGAKSPGLHGACRKSFFCATGPMKWSTLKNSLPHGQLSAVLRNIYWIILNWTANIPFLNYPSLLRGAEKQFFSSISARNTELMYWAFGKAEN